jgi:MFS superfamily sulfate permease-like transporter
MPAILEDYIADRVATNCPIRNVVLMCSAINEIDLSALESLEAINHRLGTMGVKLHLSEVKGPVMDKLQKSHCPRKTSPARSSCRNMTPCRHSLLRRHEKGHLGRGGKPARRRASID